MGVLYQLAFSSFGNSEQKNKNKILLPQDQCHQVLRVHVMFQYLPIIL